ncbi:hypothetical protein JOF29_003643 [Kribbella aluminosa]|uniref:Uncharacterized protein n=1 Tax=Kribbella aluminosa TaxID=416017 RepID=A0ABS4ULQ6_9ACTN|nr:hypothetical protein [Kribbella aluminosa]
MTGESDFDEVVDRRTSNSMKWAGGNQWFPRSTALSGGRP